MKNFRNVLILLGVLILQVGVGSFFSTWQVVPNFILITILAWCLLCEYSESLLWAFIGGVFLEIYDNPVLFGTNIFSIILVVSIANMILYYSLKRVNYIAVILTGFLGTFLYDVLQFGLKEHSRIVQAGVFVEYFQFNLKLFLWEGVLNSIILALLIYFLQKTKRISKNFREFEF